MAAPQVLQLLELTEQIVSTLSEGDLDLLEKVLEQREALLAELQQIQAGRPFSDEEKAIIGRVALWQQRIEEATEQQRAKLKERLLSRRNRREGAIAYARSQGRRNPE